MKVWLSIVARLLLIAFLLGSEWCGSAQCSEQASSSGHQTNAASVSDADTFEAIQIVLRIRGDLLGLGNSIPLPQDDGRAVATTIGLAATSKHSFPLSIQDGWAALSGQSLLLQHTRLQL